MRTDHRAQAVQPSVVYIDDVEQLTIKGKKKDMAPGGGADAAARARARREGGRFICAAACAEMLGKFLAAIVTHAEKLGKEHRVLIIGNSRNPQNPKASQQRAREGSSRRSADSADAPPGRCH